MRNEREEPGLAGSGPSESGLAGSKERFLPIEVDELAEELVRGWDGPERSHLEAFCSLYSALHRARMGARVARLKRCYRPFDPDRDTRSLREATGAEIDVAQTTLHGELVELLRQANYVEIAPGDLDEALTKTSPRGLVVSVDLDDFDELGLHYRGAYVREDQVRDPRRLFLRKRSIRTLVYQRLFIFLKLREDAGDPGAESVPSTQRIYLKLFRDVPQSDLEMLLPNTRVRMRVFDKLKLGVTGGGGTAGGVVATVTKLGAAASPMTWALALAGLAGVLWRQISKVLAQRTRYMADLAQQLYFKNLDNNRGALVHLVESADSEEAKEALLAYATIARAGSAGQTQPELDQAVESYLKETFGVDVDYEVEDGVAKLEAAGLLVPGDDGRLRVLEPDRAVTLLDDAWDAMFAPA